MMPASTTITVTTRSSGSSWNTCWILVFLAATQLVLRPSDATHDLRFLSPIEESMLDGIECFPGGSQCDIAQLMPVQLEQTNNSSSSSLETSNRAESKLCPGPGCRFIFLAFGHVFDVVLRAPTNQSRKLHNCLYSGHLFGMKRQSRAHFTVCHTLSGRIETYDEKYLIIPDHSTLWLDEAITTTTNEPQKLPEAADEVDQTIWDSNVSFRVYRENRLLSTLNSPNHQALDLSDLKENVGKEWEDRHRRSYNFVDSEWPPTSRDNWLEVVVVADYSMVKYHGEYLYSYISTLMQIVKKIYLHPSLGNRVQVALVKLVILDESVVFAKSVISHNGKRTDRMSAYEMLKEFCKWQLSHIHVEHDVTLLLTRENICRNLGSTDQNCDTLGLAELGTLCSNTSCAVVQDNGLSAAFTIAHEIGHVLNMPHDDDQKCKVFLESDSMSKVMSRMLDQSSNPWEWSKCSRHHIVNFLDANLGNCMKNSPSSSIDQDDGFHYPGQIFDENRQCEFVFGNGSKICSYMPPCRRLWCTTTDNEANGCRTQHMPWADGTPCGPGKWCLKSECVANNQQLPRIVHGQWGPWSEWTECSRTCGGGIRRSERYCDSPAPSNGGLYCVGERVQYESCNTDECLDGKDFRLQQCEHFNGNNLNILGISADVTWVPKYNGIRDVDKCKLFCRIKDSSAYYLLGATVLDGTPCGADTFDKCVGGQCIPAGCDHVLGSDKRLDWCGICGGDNSTCEKVSGSFNGIRYGYNKVARIPPGSTNIEITQTAVNNLNRDDSYIALKSEDGDYILNGGFVMSMFKRILQYGGVTMDYSGSDSPIERVNSSRPLKKALDLEVLIVGDMHPPQLEYSYVISKAGSENFRWKSLHRWSHCNMICQGQQYSHPVCVQNKTNYEREVPDEKCSSLPKPRSETKNCNTHCNLTWQLKSRSPCSAKCGKGIQQLNYACVLVMPNYQEERQEEYCQRDASLKQPSTQIECEGPCKGVQWLYQTWSACNTSCGEGYQHRKATCVDSDSKSLPDEMCQGEPVLVRKCNRLSCPVWATSEWSECKKQCLNCSDRCTGIMVRSYWCEQEGRSVPKSLCVNSSIPPHSITCQIENCNQPPENNEEYGSGGRFHWTFSRWQGCDDQCYQNRKVTCHDRLGNRRTRDKMCSDMTKPRQRQICLDGCPGEGKWGTGEWSACSATCGRAKQSRQVKCINRISQRVMANEKACYNEVRPDSSQYCTNLPPCNSHLEVLQPSHVEHHDTASFQWKKSSWTECSQTCGGGVRTRSVVCQNNLGRQNAFKCDPNNRPSSESSCNNEPCPQWNFGAWGECDKPCDGGIQQRLVVCQNHRGDSVPDVDCQLSERPASTRTCNAQLCRPAQPKFRWKRSKWSPCSQSCGTGVSKREVQCVDMNDNGRQVDDLLCLQTQRKRRHNRKKSSFDKPKDKRKCQSIPCPYQWVPGSWSECSQSCGRGVHQRTVTCHRVNRYNWIDPEPSLPHGCDNRSKPKEYQACSINPSCQAKFFWKPGPWSACSKEGRKCGDRGKQTRQIFCIDESGRKVGKPLCKHNQLSKPQRVRQCEENVCGYENCLDVKKKTGSTRDGEYNILLAGKNVSIYCHAMDSNMPQEFITLPSGDEENFSEIYRMRLNDPNSCPNNGTRDDHCDCVLEAGNRQGLTLFHKVKINVTSLKVNTHDFTFARIVHGQFVPFGEAGDCYSSAYCPQGRFRINLVGTGLRVSPYTGWVGQGTKPSLSLQRVSENQILDGKCGGYCGTCVPEPHLGLKLDLLPPS